MGCCKAISGWEHDMGLPLEDFNTKATTIYNMLEAFFDKDKLVFAWEHLELQSLSRVLLPDDI